MGQQCGQVARLCQGDIAVLDACSRAHIWAAPTNYKGQGEKGRGILYSDKEYSTEQVPGVLHAQVCVQNTQQQFGT